MPTVPNYKPVAQAAQFIATPSVSENTPIGAFGGGTAEALSHLGSVAAHVGDEIFARASALQDLQNDVESDNASTDYMIKSAKLHADFGALDGEAKAKAYPKYVEDLQTVRDGIGSRLSNPAVQRSYDKNSRSFMGREIFNGAGQAASAQRKSAYDASSARVDAYKSTITNPDDDLGFQNRLQGTSTELDKQGDIAGWSQDELNNRKGQAISKLWSERIQLQSRTSPFTAQKTLEDAQKSGNLREDDFKRADAVVRQATHTTGARNISEAVNSGWAPYMKQHEIDRAQGVEPSLLSVVKEAQRAHPELQFTVGGQGGKRSQAEQDALYAQGRTAPGPVVTWTRDSDHLRGVAIDLDSSRGSPQAVRVAMEEASAKLGIPLNQQPGLAAKDPGHFALAKDFDPAKAPPVPEEPLQSRVDRASAWARQQNPDDSLFDDYTRERVATDFNKAKTIKRDADFRAGNTIDSAIVGGFGKGNLPTTIEELKSTSPEVAAAWDSMDGSKQRKYLSYLAKNAKGDTGWTSDSLRRYQQLKGMSNADPAGFLELDVVGENVPNSAKRELINLQQKLKVNAEGDPRVRQAMSQLLPLLGPADLARRTDSNKDQYDQFVGALQDQLGEFQSQNKRAPKGKELQEMGAQLLQQQSTPRWYNPWSSTPTYAVPVPEDESDRIKNLPAWGQLGVTPTDQMIQRIFVREQFQKLYGGSAKKAEADAGPQVPRR